MPIRWVWTLPIVLLASVASGEGYSPSLTVSDGKDHQASATPTAGLHKPLDRRPSLAAGADAEFTAEWKVVRTAKDDEKDVLVHFYVVKIDREGQAPPPLDPKVVVMESALTMDFPPGEKSSAKLRFRLPEAGLYLVRIEAGGDPRKAVQPDFAELELSAK
jgi:hypothetical protein